MSRARACARCRYTHDDLKNIFESELKKTRLLALSPAHDADDWYCMDTNRAESALSIHREICTLVDKRVIGRGGGPFEFNLRDLSKLTHVLAGNSKNLQHHFRYRKELGHVRAAGGDGPLEAPGHSRRRSRRLPPTKVCAGW